MKKPHCRMEFVDERDADVMRCFRMAAASAAQISLKEITGQIARMPAKRFWVSQERACSVISCIARGMPVLHGMRPCKQRLYIEIFRRVAGRQQSCPQRTLTDIVSEVIEEPAPEFYMEPLTILDIIYKSRRARK